MATEVLVIEDSRTQALKIKLILEREGLTVSVAQSGRAGIKIAQYRPPQAIVLDVNLPDIDGFRVCQLLKEHPSTADTLVVMFTVKDGAADALSGLEAGADAYIPKDDFAEANLLQTLRDLAVLN